MSDSRKDASTTEEFSRRSFLGVGGVALATAALSSLTVHAQQQGKSDPASYPGQENVPAVAGHYVENTGDTDLVFLEMFNAEEFQDISLNNWIRRLPPEMITAHLNLDAASIRKIPVEKQEILIR